MGMEVALVNLAILYSGDFLDGSGRSLVSELLWRRLMVGLLSSILARVGFDGRSL